MLDQVVTQDRESITSNSSIAGEFTEFKGERFYVISNVDKMPPFFINVVSNSDHWLFISSDNTKYL